MSKKITMTHEEAEKALAEYDWAALVDICPDYVLNQR